MDRCGFPFHSRLPRPISTLNNETTVRLLAWFLGSNPNRSHEAVCLVPDGKTDQTAQPSAEAELEGCSGHPPDLQRSSSDEEGNFVEDSSCIMTVMYWCISPCSCLMLRWAISRYNTFLCRLTPAAHPSLFSDVGVAPCHSSPPGISGAASQS